MSAILEKFLIRNNYTHFNRKDIALQLQTHPQNPSFRAITDTLDYFGIENVAANVPEDSLPSLPTNFLTMIDRDGPELVLVVKKKNWVHIYYERKKRERHTFSEFQKIWSRKVIAIEETAKRGLQSIWLNVLYAILVIGVFVAFLFTRDVTWISSFILLLSAVGFYISLLLVKEKMGYHSVSIHSICTATSNSDCDAVINSKGAMLTKKISLADAGLLFFSIVIFYNIFFGYNNIISLLILFSIPAIIFSIYYQALVLRKWCPLCLGIASVLAVLNILIFWNMTYNISISQIIELLMTMVVLVPTYFFIKNLIATQKAIEEKLLAASSFKRNPEVIKHFMRNAGRIEDLNLIRDEIRLGNPEAKYKIIAFTNPFCGFCKTAFESYVKIIKAHQNVEIWIRFNSDYKNREEASTKITVRLMELYFEEGSEYFMNAYLDWFEDKEAKLWLKKYNSPKFEEQTMLLLKAHKNWAIKNSITHTPSTFIEGEEFPNAYGYEDLTLVIDDIIELQEKNGKLLSS